MTWADLVRKYFPDADDQLVEFLLWEKTCFPFGSAEEVERRLRLLAGDSYE